MLSGIAFFLWMLAGIRSAPIFFVCSGKLDRAAFGSTLGIILGSWTAFILFLFLGHSLSQKLILIGLPLAPLFYRLNFSGLKFPSPAFLKNPWLLAGIVAAVLFWLRVSHETVFETSKGIFTGIETNFGDLGENTAFTQYFAWGNHDLQNPLYNGIFYQHHFMSNFQAALFSREGIDVGFIFQAQTFLFGLLMTLLLGIFVKRFTQSTVCAVLAPVLLFTSGSLLQIFEPQILDGKILWQNFLITRVMTQRSFLLGVPALCLVLVLLWDARKNPETRLWISAGVITGLMPVLQIFCFMGSFLAGSLLCLLKSPRAFFLFIIPAAALAVPQLLYLTYGAGVHPLIFTPGWFDSFKNGPVDFIIFWLRNTGVLWPLVISAMPFLSRQQLLFYIPFLFLFAAANTVLLTPEIQTNANLMYIWLIGSIPPVLILFQRLWKISKAGPVLTVLLFSLLTAGGFRQLGHWLGERPGPFLIISAEEKTFSRELKEKTRPDELFLTQPTYNHPVFWAGRKILMGYEGWVWGHGWGDFKEPKKIAKAVYEGAPEAEQYLRDYKIQMIVVGPREQRSYKVNTAFLEKIGDKILDSSGHAAYRVKAQSV